VSNQDARNFNPWWALIFSFLIINLFPIPFDLLLSFAGDWVYFNPSEVEMYLVGMVKLYPIKHNLMMILAAPSMIYFIVWRMKKRGLDIKNELGIYSFNKHAFFKSVIFLGLFLVLEEIYMQVLQIEIQESFLKFILSKPIVLGIIATIIIAPVLEEFIFRGFLLSQLKNKFGNWWAIILSSLAWTSVHFQYELKILAAIFLFGLLLGFYRLKYNSLFLVIILHAINNIIGFLVAYLAYS
jgi:membrane protease YdiL (CAAX protease family)